MRRKVWTAAGAERPCGLLLFDTDLFEHRHQLARESRGNEAIFAQQKQQAIDYVDPDQTILIEIPAAVTKTTKHRPRPRRFSTTCTRLPRSGSSPTTATGPSSTASPRPDEFKTPPRSSRSPTRRLERGTRRSSSIPTTASCRDREGHRRLDVEVTNSIEVDSGRAPAGAVPVGRSAHSGFGLGMGFVMIYLSLIVLHPARRGRLPRATATV